MEDTSNESCSVCLEEKHTPIVLPCDHSFCYLCIKSTLKFGNNKCPQCRCRIPDNFIEKAVAPVSSSTFDEGGSKWMYSSRNNNGWWFYENSHNLEIDTAYRKALESQPTVFTPFVINIISSNYTIDFNCNTQTNTTNGAVRNIKRVDGANLHESKGVAGVKYCEDSLVPKYEKVYPSASDDNFNPHYADSYLHDESYDSLTENTTSDESDIDNGSL